MTTVKVEAPEQQQGKPVMVMTEVERSANEAFSPLVCSLYLAACFLLILAIWLYPRGPFLTAIVSPFASEIATIRLVVDSDAQIISQGRFGWSVNLYSEQPDFARNLISSGASFVIRNYAPATCMQEPVS